VGYDLASAAQVIVPARGKALVPTDISIMLPANTYGRIAARSGLALKHHLDVGAGVIDPDYRGPVGVVLFNHSEKDYKIEVGDRVAQLILEMAKVVQVEEVQTLPETERGTSGYGSTGVNTEKKEKEDRSSKEDLSSKMS
jgi:dUTP pyrophosphatase